MGSRSGSAVPRARNHPDAYARGGPSDPHSLDPRTDPRWYADTREIGGWPGGGDPRSPYGPGPDDGMYGRRPPSRRRERARRRSRRRRFMLLLILALGASLVAVDLWKGP